MDDTSFPKLVEAEATDYLATHSSDYQNSGNDISICSKNTRQCFKVKEVDSEAEEDDQVYDVEYKNQRMVKLLQNNHVDTRSDIEDENEEMPDSDCHLKESSNGDNYNTNDDSEEMHNPNLFKMKSTKGAVVYD